MPNINAFYPGRNHGVALTIHLTKNSALEFTYGIIPSRWLGELEGERNGGNWMDGLRLLWLGKNPSGIKACNRCGCATLMNYSVRSPANKAWDNRWIRFCPCGGCWKFPGSITQLKNMDNDLFLNF